MSKDTLFSVSAWAFVVAVLVAILFLSGCVSPDDRAEKLYRDGKYEAVLERYPDSQWADSISGDSCRMIVFSSNIQDQYDLEVIVAAIILQDKIGVFGDGSNSVPRGYKERIEKKIPDALQEARWLIAAVRKNQEGRRP